MDKIYDNGSLEIFQPDAAGMLEIHQTFPEGPVVTIKLDKMLMSKILFHYIKNLYVHNC